uniref:G-patch domain-containing protein n=1 Tax=Anopheles dirus TaxID=7168 RepID=A0A182N3Z8_9DIPT
MQDDEETLCRYGTALPAFEEDAVPSKKPITVEDQIVLDSNGKRRFHGAFTGGFSAGYWNTVGSEEGWKPAEFKSSRTEKSAGARQQNPMDFMDEEDLGEFGIAPQRVQTRDDFAAQGSAALQRSTNKRPLDAAFSKGPIPGQPVLRALLEPAREKTAVKILKQMGWREGQGIGERQTRIEKRRANERTSKEQYVMKMYGCELPGRAGQTVEQADDGSEDSDSDYEITFAPDDFDPLVAALKNNSFGLGYSGLDRGESSKGFRLFDTLELVDRNNKKLSIRGQAFGIGALEDDDDLDVYARDDMSRYDFSLEDKTRSKRAIESRKSSREANTLEGFRPQTADNGGMRTKPVFRVAMPDGFRPRNWEERRSRFDPLDEERAKKMQRENEHKLRGLGRHDLDPKQRGEILGETRIASNPVLERINRQSSNFVRREVLNEQEQTRPADDDTVGDVKQELTASMIPSGLVQQPKVLERQYIGSTKEGFKPFIAVPDKQERYERFISFQPTERYLTREQYLESLQPLNLSAWDRERELKEFLQAERMYRPLVGLMSERFVTASSLIADKTIPDPAAVEPAKPREIRMERTRTMWKPHKELCKRFNVPEPFGGMMADEPDATEKRRKAKGTFSVFDYLEAPVTNRRDFVTPSVIPGNTQLKPQKPVEVGDVGSSSTDTASPGQRLSSKDFFLTDTGTNANPAHLKPPSAHQPARVVHKKRTELEEKVLQATNQKPEEKRDLFKSIFCSSDEEDAAEPAAGGKALAPEQSTLTDSEKLKMVDSFMAIKPASQINVLRNDSPPRGIFKKLFEFKKPPNEDGDPSERPDRVGGVLQCSSKGEKDRPAVAASATSSDSDPDSDATDSGDAECYGPKLPTSVSGPREADRTSEDQELDARLQHLLGGGGGQGKERSGEIWIEKDHRSSSEKAHKKKKKHKQHHHKNKTKSKKDKKDKKRSSSHKHKSRR